MEEFHNLSGYLIWLIPVIIFLALWDGVWKIIAMWKSARRKQLGWFICIAIFNTLGILPIIYILLHKDSKESDQDDHQETSFKS